MDTRVNVPGSPVWRPCVCQRSAEDFPRGATCLLMCPTSSSTNSAMCALPSPPPPSRCTQGGRGGHDLGPGREQPGHRVGAGGPALRLQPQVQQAGQRRVAHALRAHLPQTVPTCPLGSRVCSGRHNTSSLHPPTPTTTTHQPAQLLLSHHLYYEDQGTTPPPCLRISVCHAKSHTRTFIHAPPHPSPAPGRTIEVNTEAPAHSVLRPKGFYLCLLHPQAPSGPCKSSFPQFNALRPQPVKLGPGLSVCGLVRVRVCVVGWDSQGDDTIG